MSRVLAFILTLILVLAAVLFTAVFLFVDLGSGRAAQTIDLLFKSLAAATAIGAVAVSLIAVFHKQKPAITTPSEGTPAPAPPDALSGPPLDEAESLRIYLAQMRGHLGALQTAGGSFPAAATNQRTVQPNLELPGGDTLTLGGEPTRVLDRSELIAHHRVILLGGPGSGKSTCLWQIAAQHLTDSPDKLPLYVSLSTWTNPADSALTFLRDSLAELVGGYGHFHVANFATLLASGRFLLLIDGLNELAGVTGEPAEPDPRERDLRHFADTTAAGCPLIIASRTTGRFDSTGWQLVHVAALTPAQIDEAVHVYAKPAAVETVLGVLRDRPALAEIATNPFFLHGVIQILQSSDRPASGPDPDSRGGILDRLCRRLIERQGRSVPDDMRAIAATLGTRAYRMLGHGQVGSRIPLPVPGSDEKPYFDLLLDAGLLVERDEAVYFRHQIVQEYLAASALHQRRIRRSPAALLADDRFTDVIALWFDLDRTGLVPRLRRCLRARNLWHRPWRGMSRRFGIYLTSAQFIALIWCATWVIDRLLWPVPTLLVPLHLSWPSPFILLAVLVAAGPVLRFFAYHRRIIANAAHVLGLGVDRPASSRMVSALGRVDGWEREVVAEALARIGPTATGHAIRGLPNRKPWLRVGCVLVLGRMIQRDPPDQPALEILLWLPYAADPVLSEALVRVLYSCTDPRALDAITATVYLSGSEFQTSSADLPAPDQEWATDREERGRRITDRLVAAAVGAGRTVQMQTTAFNLLSDLRVPGFEDLLIEIAADHATGEIRASALSALAKAQTEQAVRRLVELDEQRPDLGWMLEKAIRSVRNPAAVPALAGVPHTASPGVRVGTAIALGTVADEGAFAVLRELAQDDDDYVRLNVARAMALNQHPEAIPLLEQMARDTSRRVRREALSVLAEHHPTHAPTVLISLATDDSYTDRPEAVQKLGALRTEPGARTALTLLTGDVEPAVRDAALDAIEPHPGDPASPAARQPIRRLLRALDTYLGLSNLRRRWLAESITGRQPAAVVDRIHSAARQDAGLQRHVERITSLAGFGLVVVAALAIAVVLTLARLDVRLAALLWAVWWIDLALIGAALLTLLPAAYGLRHSQYVGGMIRLLRWTAAAGAAILAVAVLVYTWWVWLLVLLAAISAVRIFIARTQVRSRRRIAQVVQRAASLPNQILDPEHHTRRQLNRGNSSAARLFRGIRG